MKVYSSDMSNNFYGNDQNRASRLLKVISASNNVCVDYSFSPVGGDKWLLKNVFVVELFTQEIR